MVQDVSTGGERLVVVDTFATSPAELFRYWTEPELLTQWWPSEAELDPRVGGAFVLSWPQMEWNLRGVYSAFDAGERLAFSWNWDHEPDMPERQVEVRFEPDGDHTRMTISHGPYDDSPRDQGDRQSHLDGWQFFCGRLGELVNT